MFIAKHIFRKLVTDLKSELGQVAEPIELLIQPNGHYFTRLEHYNTVTLHCGQGSKAWDTVGKIRVSKTMKEFEKLHKATRVMDMHNGTPRVKINF